MDRREWLFIGLLLSIVCMMLVSPMPSNYSSAGLGLVEQSFVPAAGESWLSGWSYRQSHDIVGSSGAGTLYPMEILVEYGSGSSSGNVIYCDEKSRTDFGDIRFTDDDGDTELDYWMEEKTDSDDATFWVEVADDLGSNQVIYVYYGNDGASTTSEIKDTFLVGDDFDDASIDTGIWNVSTAGFTETGGYLHFDYASSNRGEIYGLDSYLYNVEMVTSIKCSSSVHGGNVVFGFWEPAGWATYERAYNGWSSGNTRFYRVTTDETTSTVVYRSSWVPTTLQEISIFWISGHVYYRVNGALDEDRTTNVPNEPLFPNFEEGTDNTYQNDMDWVYYRKKIASEPTHSSWGSEEEANSVPINDSAPSCTNLDDTDYLYARYRVYEFSVSVTDADGYADIDYVEIRCIYSSGTFWSIRYNETSDVFSEEAGDTYIAESGSTKSKSGINLDITFKLYIEWACPDETDYDLQQYVIDEEAESDSDDYDVNYNYESRLDFTVYSLSDGLGTVDRGSFDTLDGITASGTVIYYGSSDNYAPTGEVDVWVSCADVAGSAWSDLTLTSGAFSMTVDSDDVVGLDTYTFIVVSEGTGAGGTNLLNEAHTDTYIADRAQVSSVWSSDSDNRTGLGTNVVVYCWVQYDYDDTNVTNGIVQIWRVWSAGSGEWRKLIHDVDGTWKTEVQTITTSVSTFLYVNISDSTKMIEFSGTNTHGMVITNANNPLNRTLTQIWDRVNLTVVSNLGWTVIGYNTTLSATGTFEYDASAWSGAVTWSDQYPTQLLVGTYEYGSTKVSSVTDPTYGVLAFMAGTNASVIFDDAEVTSVAHDWFQQDINNVWLILITGTWTWEINGTPLSTGADGLALIVSHMNGSDDDWAALSSTGTIGDLIVGPFGPSWDSVLIGLMVETTIDGISYDWRVWVDTIDVDILHSIHIEDSGMNIQDSWITFYFHTNWNNATFTIWNNRTGSASEVGFSSNEGWYQIVKDTTVGTHWYWILVNGTHGGFDSTGQNFDPTDISDDWEWLNFKVTVNPITFSITDIYVIQNNCSIVVGGIFSTSDLSVDYTVYEDGVYVASGTANIPTSGSYYVIRWSKSSETSVANWTLVMSAGTNITIYGFNLLLDDATYIYNSSGHWEDNDYIMGDSLEVIEARAADSMWDTLGLIVTVLMIPFVVGIAVKTDRARGSGRKGKRDKANDKFRTQ